MPEHFSLDLQCTMTVSLTQIQTYRVSFVTHLRNQSCQLAGWGSGETRAMWGEAICSYLLLFCKLSFTIFEMMEERVLFSFAKLQKEKWWAFMFDRRIWKSESQTVACSSFFSRALFCHKTYTEVWLLVIQYKLTCWSAAKSIFLMFYPWTVFEHICSVLDNVS